MNSSASQTAVRSGAPAANDEDHAFLAEVVRRNIGLQAEVLPRALRVQEAAVRQRWKRWLRYAAGNDWRLLRRRMRAEGLRPGALFLPRTAQSWPDWAFTLQEIRAQARRLATMPGAADGLLPPGAQAVPFAELLAPCLVVARRRLDALLAAPSGGKASERMVASSTAALERTLLRRLGQACGPVLLAAFDAKRAAPPMLAMLVEQSEQAPRKAYRAFVHEQLASGLETLGGKWPVALRLMAQLTEQWADSTAELVLRLDRDAKLIQEAIFPGAPALGRVASIDSGLSDPHAEGRTVLEVTFEDARRLVYKPRPMDMERIFADTLRGLEATWTTPHPAQRIPRVLALGDYGWMEWIDAAPLGGAEEAAVYHWRLGGLMAVLRAMRGTDMHRENLVAAGAYPVFVDVECLLHPSAQPFLEIPAAAAGAGAEPLAALLHTGMLPFYESTEDGLNNLGAIAGSAQTQGSQETVFQHVGTDWMRMGQQPIQRSTHHQPRSAAGWVNAFEHVASIAAGYQATLAHLLQHREWLLTAPDSPWQALPQARGRHLARSSWHYGLLLQGAVAPESLTDGLMFDLTFEPLNRHLHLVTAGYRSMAAAERRDLRRLDVPRFGFAADSLLLHDAHGRPLQPMHVQTPLATMASQLRALSAEQVHGEAAMLASALAEYRPAADASLATLTADLRGRAQAHFEGPARWIGLTMQGEAVRIGPLGPGLYAGTAGLALALAGAGRALACRSSTALAMDTLREAMESVAQLPSDVAPLPLGLDQGLAGLLYAADACAALGDAPALRDEAHRCLRSRIETLNPGRHALPGRSLDLLNGLAGLVGVLLRWAHVFPGERLWREAARRCGAHLLHQARPEAAGISWGAPGTAGLSGLSHGNSGFALALAALYRADGDPAYRRAAFDALDYEATLFAPEWGNWRDLRGFRGGDVQQVRRCGCSWCHGAPGIALARAALLTLLADDLSAGEHERLTRELETALTSTRTQLARRPQILLDDLCCGSAGSIDILLECGRLLRRPELVQAARDEARARTG